MKINQICKAVQGALIIIITSGTGQAATLHSSKNNITPENKENNKTLPSIHVIDTRDDKSKSGDYGSEHIKPGRTNKKKIESPRSITVVPESLIQDQKASSESEMLRNVSGTYSAADYSGIYEFITIRGIESNNLYSYLKDGHKYPHFMPPADFNINRIEVIKGPNGIEQGLSTPGGLINYISKQPSFSHEKKIKIETGSNKLGRISFDISGPINKEKTLRYIITSGYRRNGSLVDHVDPVQYGLATALDWDINERSSLRLSAESLYLKQRSSDGIPVPDPNNLSSANSIRAGNFYGDLDLFSESKGTSISLKFENQINETWNLSGSFFRGKLKRDIANTNIDSLNEERTKVKRYHYGSMGNYYHNDGANLSVNGKFSNGRIEKTVTYGVDHGIFRGVYAPYFFVDAAEVDIFKPTASHEASRIKPQDGSEENPSERLSGLFFSGSVELDKKHGVQLGLRYDKIVDRIKKEETRKTSPTFSIYTKSNDNALSYFSYSTSFEPNFGTKIFGGSSAAPSRGKQLEIGFKKLWMQGKLDTALSLYQIKKTNIPMTDPDNADYSILTGEVLVRGIEIEASGEVSTGLNFVGSLSFSSPKIVSDSDPGKIGHMPSEKTKKSATLWALYKLPFDNRWEIGGGAFYMGKISSDSQGRFFVPSKTTFDLMARYRINKNTVVDLSVKNASDRRFYRSANVDSRGFYSARVGQPRTVIIGLESSF